MKTESLLFFVEKNLIDAEKKISVIKVATLVAFVLMAIAMIYVAPALEPKSGGVFNAGLAAEPFQLGNPHVYRFLTPLISYLIGLRGNGIIITSLATVWLLLTCIYVASRKLDYSPGLSFALTALFAFTMPTLVTIYFGGYEDTTTYLLIFLMLVFKRNFALFWGLFFLGLTNRESVGFLTPLFFMMQYQQRKWHVLWKDLPIFLLILFVYLYIRHQIPVDNSQELYTAEFYFRPLLENPFYMLKNVMKSYYAGFFSVFKLFWLVPIFATGLCIKHKNYSILLLIVTPVICAFLQSFIASDTTRMMSLSFLTIFFSVDYLRNFYSDSELAKIFFICCGLNFFIPQIYVTGDSMYVMHNIFSYYVGTSFLR